MDFRIQNALDQLKLNLFHPSIKYTSSEYLLRGWPRANHQENIDH